LIYLFFGKSAVQVYKDRSAQSAAEDINDKSNISSDSIEKDDFKVSININAVGGEESQRAAAIVIVEDK